MTTRNLDAVFRPERVALVRASTREGSVGAVPAASLSGGGFGGAVDFAHPAHRRLHGRRVYPRIADLPAAPDPAVVATPPGALPDIVAERAGLCRELGFRLSRAPEERGVMRATLTLNEEMLA